MSQGRVPLSQTESAKDSGHYLFYQAPRAPLLDHYVCCWRRRAHSLWMNARLCCSPFGPTMRTATSCAGIEHAAAKAWSNESCELKESVGTFELLMYSFQSPPGDMVSSHCYPSRWLCEGRAGARHGALVRQPQAASCLVRLFCPLGSSRHAFAEELTACGLNILLTHYRPRVCSKRGLANDLMVSLTLATTDL